LPGSIIIGISSPYRKKGLLYKKYQDHYGKPSIPPSSATLWRMIPRPPARNGWQSSATTLAILSAGAL
jgi:hypothetical protein